MFQPTFEGDNFSYFYENDIEEYLLIDKKGNNHLFLKDVDAIIFIEHIKLINIEPETIKKEKIEEVIKSFFIFNTPLSPLSCYVDD
jgi:hypothetical protein